MFSPGTLSRAQTDMSGREVSLIFHFVVLNESGREVSTMVREDVSSLVTYCVILVSEVVLDHPCWTSVVAAAVDNKGVHSLSRKAHYR